MNQFLLRANLIVLAMAFAATASALPKIDPLLRPLLTQPSEANKIVTVIALFKDKGQVPRLEHSIVGRAQSEVALLENAKASQMATYQGLMKLRTEGASNISFQSLWLLNAAVIHVNTAGLKQLAANEDLTVIYADHPVHIIPDAVAPGGISADPYTYGLTKINLPQLRAKAPTVTGAGVRVGVLDTGVDATHPDLKDRVVLFKDFVGNKTTPYDDHGHGTHVSGTISGGNASGTVIGVAPGVKILMGKVFTSTGSGSMAAILSAMQWIADPDGDPKTPDQPMLVSNSWGGGNPSSSKDPVDEPLCKAVAGWVKLGILPVFAAGNAGPGAGSVNLPGACPQSLTAGATDSNDAIASFSSRGPAVWKSGSVIKPTVSAPGVAVISSVPGGGYKAMSGTSMATPHLAGLSALVYQVNPKMTVEQVTKVIADSSTHLGAPGPNNDFGAGRIDAFNTIKNVLILKMGRNPADYVVKPTGVPEL